MFSFLKNLMKKDVKNVKDVKKTTEAERLTNEEIENEKRITEEIATLSNLPPVPKKVGCVVQKLGDKQKAHISKLIGEFVTNKRIMEIMSETYGIEVTSAAITHYRNYTTKKWKKIALEARQKYLSRLEDVPGYHKRVRLERMEHAVEKCVDKNDMKTMISAVAQQQKEVEGGEEKLSSINVYLQQLNIMGDDELQRELENTKDYIMKLEKKKVIEVEAKENKPD